MTLCISNNKRKSTLNLGDSLEVHPGCFPSKISCELCFHVRYPITSAFSFAWNVLQMFCPASVQYCASCLHLFSSDHLQRRWITQHWTSQPDWSDRVRPYDFPTAIHCLRVHIYIYTFLLNLMKSLYDLNAVCLYHMLYLLTYVYHTYFTVSYAL